MHGKPIANTRSVMGIPTAKLAVYWVIGSEIVIFGGLIASYLLHRLAHPEWSFDAAHTDWRIGAVNTFVLLTSSLFAVQAHHYAHKGDGATAAKWLYLTTGGGGLFLMFKAYEWSVEIGHGYTITAAPFWSFYYTAAGIHASHIIAGMIIMMFIAQTAKKNEELHRVENIGLYWHFVDLVWIFLFPLLYIAK